MCKKYIFYVFHYPTRSSHIYEEQDTLQKRKKNLINKLMAKGDLQRQYSLSCEVAGQAQSFTVIESSFKPLTYLYLYLF